MEKDSPKLKQFKVSEEEIRIKGELLDSDLFATIKGSSSTMGGTKKINNSLKMVHWNARGLAHPSKIQTINATDCDIMAIQEIDHPTENLLECITTKSVITKRERDAKGGGTITLSNLEITHITRYNINKDCEIARIIIDGVFILWIGNIYLNKGLPKQIQKLFSIINENIPENERQNIILLGDFNINLNKKSPKLTLLNNLCKQFQLSIQDPKSGTRDLATLDFIITGKGIEAALEDNLKSCSDHNILTWRIHFNATPRPKKSLSPIKNWRKR